jgi:hypothetical protein
MKGLVIKTYRIKATTRDHCPVQGPGVDLSVLDVEVLFIQPNTRRMGEPHEEIHESFLRQIG